MDNDIQHHIDTATTALTTALALMTQQFQAQIDGIAALPSMPKKTVAKAAAPQRRRRKAASTQLSLIGVPANEA